MHRLFFVMRVHHMNCISTCPIGGALMDGETRGLRGRLTCHCLLVEAGSQLVLIDTGFGLRDVADPKSRLSRFFLFLLSPELREEMTAIRQVQRLGYDPRDVRHVVLTHLDFDHAGGLDDFPDAAVHMLADEREIAEAQRTTLDRMRYRPAQWSTRPRWQTYRATDGLDAGERWFGFRCVRELRGVPPEILLVPLAGHTMGHAGVAIQDDRGWLLQAGDAYFFHEEMNVERPRCTPGLRFYQWMMQQDGHARVLNQARLRELIRTHRNEVEVFCAHDVTEFERLAHRSSAVIPDTRSPVFEGVVRA